MRRALRVGIELTLLVTFANLPAIAQNYLYGAGNPAWGINIPIENGFINVANGNVHMEIPVGNQPQRGSLSLSETVVYDSRIWTIVNSGTSYSFQPASCGGWTLGGSAYASGNMQENLVNETVPCSGSSGSQGYLETTYTWTDASGTAHMFAPGIYSLYSPNCPNGNTGGITNTTSGNAYSVDGSGYYMSVVPYTYDGYATYSAIVFDPSGNSPSLLEDRNGNYVDIAYTESSGVNTWTWTDTLNRKAFAETVQSGSPTYLDVRTIGGVTKQYTLKYETINVKTNFGQSDVTEYSGTLSVLQSLTLPDGTSYTFNYDLGTTSGHYGELTSMMLPTGGTVSFGYNNYLDSYQNQNRWVNSYAGGNGSYSFYPQVVTQCSGARLCHQISQIAAATR